MSVFLYCGGHHDSDRTAVLVWSPRLKLLYCKYHQFMYTLPNKDFLPSFLPSFLPALAYAHKIHGTRNAVTTHLLNCHFSFCFQEMYQYILTQIDHVTCFATTNLRYVRQKYAALSDLISSKQIDIIAMTDTCMVILL